MSSSPTFYLRVFASILPTYLFCGRSILLSEEVMWVLCKRQSGRGRLIAVLKTVLFYFTGEMQLQ